MSKRYRHHKYTWSKPFTSVRHDWSFCCSKGGINFHVSLTPGYSDSAGLELHSVKPMYGDEAPHHLNCPITGGRCWHDGTSLYASEQLWPVVQGWLRAGDHEAIFRYLEGEADQRFYGGRSEKSEDEDEPEESTVTRIRIRTFEGPADAAEKVIAAIEGNPREAPAKESVDG